MKRTVIRYKTRPERTEENERLIRRVFRQLQVESPKGLRYLALRLGTDVFIHVVEADAGKRDALARLGSFQRFLSGVRERCSEPPQTDDATILGSYRMLAEK